MTVRSLLPAGAVVALAAIFLGACGQRGPLYIPDEAETRQSVPATQPADGAAQPADGATTTTTPPHAPATSPGTTTPTTTPALSEPSGSSQPPPSSQPPSQAEPPDEDPGAEPRKKPERVNDQPL